MIYQIREMKKTSQGHEDDGGDTNDYGADDGDDGGGGNVDIADIEEPTMYQTLI
jgi:hypothetical protein